MRGSALTFALNFALAFLLTFTLAGCMSDPREHADAIAHVAGLQREQIRSGLFVLTSYSRITRTDRPLVVYIEGDGRAWLGRTRPSPDPTPRRALGLELAAADSGPNVLYLARPCQFTDLSDDPNGGPNGNPNCNVTYWTGRRYAEEVVASMNLAITQYLQRLPGQQLSLVGYSGGGALAVLIAARRNDVASLYTVAGNLDIVAVNRLHGVSPMPDSLNPVDVAQLVRNIPQWHFSGADDTVVPVTVTQSFVAAAGQCARWRVLDGMGHEGKWAAQWPALHKAALPCNPPSAQDSGKNAPLF